MSIFPEVLMDPMQTVIRDAYVIEWRGGVVQIHRRRGRSITSFTPPTSVFSAVQKTKWVGLTDNIQVARG